MKPSIRLFLFGFLSAVFLFSCVIVLSSYTKKETITSDNFLESMAISWDEAVSLRNFYKANQPLKVQSGNSQVPLEGFTIEANQLLEIISNNKVGGKADQVMFYLGAEAPDRGSSLPKYNLIAVGLNGGQLMIPSSPEGQSNPSQSSVFDKASPCPPFCPE